LQGYRSALQEVGIEYRPHYVVEATFDLQNNLAAPRKLLDRDDAITAIFCLNDHIALGVYDVLRERNLRVGDDVSVVGFDNSDFCNYLMPSLTSVNFPTTEMGSIAAQKVMSIVKGTEFNLDTTLSPDLVVRQSVKRL
jgi:LacI family transcriptional regulator